MRYKTLDSRDLEKELKNLIEQKEEQGKYFNEDEELKEIQDLKAECEGCGWDYGILFINENYFEDYAEELFNKCYAHNIPKNLRHYINYKQFSDDLEQDYSNITFRGEEWLWIEA